MSDGIIILSLVLVFVLGCLGAGLHGRRLRARARNDLELRYLRARFLCTLSAFVIPLMLVAGFQQHDKTLFQRFFSPGCFAVVFGINLFQFLQARKKLLAQPNFTWPPKKPLPLFFWQAVLILLPVALMSAFGFWAILKERNAVEQQAQQRAKEILSSLPDEFGRIAASKLTQLDGPKGGWFSYLEGGVAAWPGNKNHNLFLTDTNEAQIIARNLAELHAAFPDWHDGTVPLINFSLNTNGDFSFNNASNFQPPDWLATMSAEQLRAWAELQTAAYASESLSNRVKTFQQTKPSPSALACADFLLLRSAVPTMSATNAMNKLLRFAGRHYNDISESGVPLRTLALADALHLARDCGPNEQLWDGLQSEISSPSALTPILLDEAERLVANDAELTASVKAMRILFADKLAQSEMAEAVRKTGKLDGIATTNLWLNAMGRKWFCVLSPSASQLNTSISNRSVLAITAITQVQCYPESIVARGFADAFKDAKISLPDYFSISVELEGEQIPLPPTWIHLHDKNPDVLAEQQFTMSQRAGTTLTGEESRDALFKAMPDSHHEGKEIFFEAMPSHPKFSLQIRLTDRSLLYARQRQLQFIFGALIAVSALAALVGFVAAYRAFHREQQLGELKSNFVSSVSHELRAPIASVRLMAENLERGKISEAGKQNEYFRFIVQECRRLSSLIENVLDFSRIEQGRKQYEFEPTNLLALTETTVKLMEPYAAEKGVELKWETSNIEHPTPNIELDVDGRAIQQALVNLIDNAIKHSAKGQTVMVEIQNKKLENENTGSPGAANTSVINYQPTTINLSVTDHGPGIPAAEQQKIFERFYRLGSELRRETQGVGIGLSVVKHIVEAHGGRVLVQSEPGQGSRFTIELPVKK